MTHRTLQAALVEPERDVVDFRVRREACNDLARVGHARHVLRWHEGHHLDLLEASVRQRVDQFDLARGGNRPLLELEALTRAFLIDADRFGQVTHARLQLHCYACECCKAYTIHAAPVCCTNSGRSPLNVPVTLRANPWYRGLYLRRYPRWYLHWYLHWYRRCYQPRPPVDAVRRTAGDARRNGPARRLSEQADPLRGLVPRRQRHRPGRAHRGPADHQVHRLFHRD